MQYPIFFLRRQGLHYQKQLSRLIATDIFAPCHAAHIYLVKCGIGAIGHAFPLLTPRQWARIRPQSDKSLLLQARRRGIFSFLPGASVVLRRRTWVSSPVSFLQWSQDLPYDFNDLIGRSRCLSSLAVSSSQAALSSRSESRIYEAWESMLIVLCLTHATRRGPCVVWQCQASGKCRPNIAATAETSTFTKSWYFQPAWCKTQNIPCLSFSWSSAISPWCKLLYSSKNI